MKHDNRNRLIQVLSIIIAVLAYGYLLYRLITYDHYADFAQQFLHADAKQMAALAVAVLLFPFNILAEALKWRYLLRGVYPMKLREALRQVYAGTTGAFITPARLGEYPTRVTLFRAGAPHCGTAKEESTVSGCTDKATSSDTRGLYASAVALGFVGSFALSSLQVIVGVPAAMRIMSVGQQVWLMNLLIFIVYLLTPCICRALSRHDMPDPKTYPRLARCLSAIADISIGQLLHTLLLSALRYTIYCTQLALVLYFCGITTTIPDLLVAIAAYYMLVTVTPSVPMADIGIRGSWAMVIFSNFTQNAPAILITTLLLWIINSVIPMLIGSLLLTKHRN